MTKTARQLTPKEAKLVKGVAEGKTRQQAAIDAGFGNNPASASTIASQTLKKLNVQQALEAEFARQGITLEAIVKPVADGLTADKPGFTDKQGNFHEGTRDHQIRLKSAGMAAQFLGIGKQSGDVTINFIGQSTEQRESYDIS